METLRSLKRWLFLFIKVQVKLVSLCFAFNSLWLGRCLAMLWFLTNYAINYYMLKLCLCFFFIYNRLYSPVSFRKLIIFLELTNLIITFKSFDLNNFSLCSLNCIHSERMCLIVRFLLHPTQRGDFSPLKRKLWVRFVLFSIWCISHYLFYLNKWMVFRFSRNSSSSI